MIGFLVPKHVLLYRAFGWEIPPHGHVPNVLDRTKEAEQAPRLDERVSVQAEGYLAEALLNFLALLGWSYDDKTDLFTREQLIEHFTLNGSDMRRPSSTWPSWNGWMGCISANCRTTHWRSACCLYAQADLTTLCAFAPIIKARIKKLSDAAALADFLFESELEYDPRLLIGKEMDAPSAVAALRAARATLDQYANIQR